MGPSRSSPISRRERAPVLYRYGTLLLLLFNTTRAHTPDPQAQEPLSQWTEVWPTQPVLTQPRKHWPLIGGAWGKKDDHPSFSARTAPVFPRLYTSSINRAAVGSSHGRRCPYPRAPLLLLLNTTRAHTPDPQAQEPRSATVGAGRASVGVHTSQIKSSQVKLRPLPSTTAGLRSTFDRLPYGCLLFMFRLDLTSHYTVAVHTIHTTSALTRSPHLEGSASSRRPRGATRGQEGDARVGPPPHTSHPQGTNAARFQHCRQSSPPPPVHPLSTIIARHPCRKSSPSTSTQYNHRSSRSG